MNTPQLSLSLSVRVRPPQASRYELGLYHDLSRFRLMSCLSFRLDLCHRVEDLNELMQPCATTVCSSPPALLGKNTINTVYVDGCRSHALLVILHFDITS